METKNRIQFKPAFGTGNYLAEKITSSGLNVNFYFEADLKVAEHLRKIVQVNDISSASISIGKCRYIINTLIDLEALNNSNLVEIEHVEFESKDDWYYGSMILTANSDGWYIELVMEDDSICISEMVKFANNLKK